MGQVEQQAKRLLGDAVLGEVEQDVLEAEGELVEAFGIVAEQVAHLERLGSGIMRSQRLPGVRAGDICHGEYPSGWSRMEYPRQGKGAMEKRKREFEKTDEPLAASRIK